MALFILRCRKCDWRSSREADPGDPRTQKAARCPKCGDETVDSIRNRTGEKANA